MTCAPFIVGVARSGTTLLRLMLDSHPELAIPPETHFAGRVLEAFAPGGSGVEGAVEAMVESKFWIDFGIPREEFECMAVDARPATAGALLRLFYTTYAEHCGKPRWGDKTPPYLERMAEIQGELPEARFIHVIRDGRDVALSVAPLWFGPDGVEEAARHWSRRVVAARAAAAELNGYVEVRYENLVEDSAATLERLCEAIDLAWDPTMLDYHLRAPARLREMAWDLSWRGGLIPAVDRMRIHALTAESPRADRVGRWRREMSPTDRHAFEAIAGEVLAELGYASPGAAGG